MKIYTYDNKVMTIGGKWMEQPAQPGPGPGPGPVLPPYTIRLKFTEGVTPDFEFGTPVRVSSSPNIWDLTYENADWSFLCSQQYDLIEVIDANTTGVTDMTSMFDGCQFLTTVPLFDTSSVTNMYFMFNDCRSITTVPLFNTSNVTDVGYMFYDCYNVESGALALYQQMSTQANPPSNYSRCFTSCGSNTTTGAAELALIPTEWGGNDGEFG